MTNEQLQELARRINDRYGYIAAQMQSEDYRPDPEQLKRWQRLGLVPEQVTPETFMLSVPPELRLIRNAFILGRCAEAVERGESFSQVMALATSLPLRKPDIEAIKVAEQQTAMYLKDNVSDLITKVQQAGIRLRNEKIRQMAIDYHRQELPAIVLDREAKEALGEVIEEKMVSTHQQFASELFHTMSDKARDWQRVAFYELGDAEKQGEAHRVMEQQGPDVLVYKRTMSTACSQCVWAYNLADGKTPRLFRLKDLMANGCNIGRRANPVKAGKVVEGGRADGAEAVKPVAGLMHNFCQCGGPYVASGYEPWLTAKQKELIKQSRAQRTLPRPPSVP